MNNKQIAKRLPVYGSFIGLIFGLLCLSSCGNNTDYIPKPKGYPRLVLPQYNYLTYNDNDCPFTFEYPSYGNINKDSLKAVNPNEHPCWMNVEFPYFNASLYLSYKSIGGDKEELLQSVSDAYKINAKHVIKADFIEDSLFVSPKGVQGVWYEVGGDAASSTQFFVTDSIAHFLWASFYVNTPPNEDSIAPVTTFIRKDLKHMLNTFEWK